MLALSIKQPWAYAIIHLGKDVENRNWKTNVRGQILIHAPKSFDVEGYNYIKYDMGLDLPEIKDIQRGGIVGAAKIIDCVTQSDSEWFFGPYGFVLKDAIELPFTQMNGALGFFTVIGGERAFNVPNKKLTNQLLIQ